MAPLARYRTSLTLFMATSFAIAILSLYVHEAFTVFLLANLLFWSWRLKHVSCDQCAHPLAPPMGASALTIFRSFTARQCANCGARLDEH
jgi:ribosomal protein S27E